MDPKQLGNYIKTKLISQTYKKGLTLDNFLKVNNGVEILGSTRSQNPQLEQIYNTISSDLSMISLNISLEKNGKYQTAMENETMLLNVRPNKLQTATEFYDTFFYNLIKYGHGIAIKNVDENGNLESLSVIDCSEYYFASTYDAERDKAYLLLREKISNEVIALDYDDIIHERYIPATIFDDEKYKTNDFNRIIEVFDKKLNTILYELTNSKKMSGVLKLKVLAGREDEAKKNAQMFIDGITSGIGVTDIGSEFQPLTHKFETIGLEEINELNEYVYNMYGINSKIITGKFTNAEYIAYYNKTLEPILKRFNDEINYKILGIEKLKKGYKINVFKDLLVGASPTEIAQIYKDGIYNGSFSPNEYRKAVGHVPYEGGDIYTTNKNAVILNIDGNKISLEGGES